MRVFSMEELHTIMREAAGEVDVGDFDLAETSYVDLGYDSLALLEVSARIKQVLGIEVPDGAVAVTATPSVTVAAVNQLLAPAVAA